MSPAKNILLIDGSVHGSSGNTAALLELAGEKLSSGARITRLCLSKAPAHEEIVRLLESADGFVIGTGTYWDSWGSPLQRFFEEMTETEGSTVWLGKPVAVIVTMHSVGGKGVLSRIQGVLNTYGALIPPMSGIVCSAVNQLALKQAGSGISDDLWRPEDLEIVCHNLLEAISGTGNWKMWPLDRQEFDKMWYER